MQMPDDTFFGQRLIWAVGNGTVPQSRVDDMVLRILTAMYMVGIMDTPQARLIPCFVLPTSKPKYLPLPPDG